MNDVNVEQTPVPTGIKAVDVPQERKVTNRSEVPFDPSSGEMLVSPAASDLFYNIGIVDDAKVYEVPESDAGVNTRQAVIDLMDAAGKVMDSGDKRQVFAQQIHSDLHHNDIVGFVTEMADMFRGRDEAARSTKRDALEQRYAKGYDIVVRQAQAVQSLLASEQGKQFWATPEGQKYHDQVATKVDSVLGKNEDGTYTTPTFSQVLDKAFGTVQE